MKSNLIKNCISIITKMVEEPTNIINEYLLYNRIEMLIGKYIIKLFFVYSGILNHPGYGGN